MHLSMASINRAVVEKNNAEFENLIIEGGGVKTLSSIGVLSYLAENTGICRFTRYAGVSMGAVVALLCCLGYTPAEMKEVALSTNFKKIVGLTFFDIMKSPLTLFNGYGLMNGVRFEKFLKKCIAKKGFNPRITFYELYVQTEKELVMNGACLEKRETYYFNWKTTPHMPVYLGVRISCSLPVLFKPIRLRLSEFHADYRSDKRYYHFVDGGLLNNFPSDYFEEPQNVMKLRHRDLSLNNVSNKTLGIRILLPQEYPDRRFFYGLDNINNLWSFLNSIMNNIDTLIQRNEIDKNRNVSVVYVKTHDLSAYSFRITRNDLLNLFEAGYQGALRDLTGF